MDREEVHLVGTNKKWLNPQYGDMVLVHQESSLHYLAKQHPEFQTEHWRKPVKVSNVQNRAYKNNITSTIYTLTAADGTTVEAIRADFTFPYYDNYQGY